MTIDFVYQHFPSMRPPMSSSIHFFDLPKSPSSPMDRLLMEDIPPLSLAPVIRDKNKEILKNSFSDQLIQTESVRHLNPKQALLTQMFYGIFNHNSFLPSDQLTPLYNKYLSDNSCRIRINGWGRRYLKIRSMRGVIQYLIDHPHTTSCNFRGCKSKIQEFERFAKYLKTSRISALIFRSKRLSKIDEEQLAETIAVRAASLQPLQIYYF